MPDTDTDHDPVPYNWPKAVSEIFQCLFLIVAVVCITTCTMKYIESPTNAHPADSRKDSPETTVPVEGR